ncbi:hypothetical protein chiPu_0025191, partial [Chiloscyllium punctatum]|nr:hypothetical protein [Chiloscyllium punctatum]
MESPKSTHSVDQYSQRYSVHGVNHICNQSSGFLRRIIWTVTFIGMVMLLFYCCGVQIQFYLRKEHVTVLDEVSGKLTDFPSVTICNLNMARRSQLTRNDLAWVGQLLGFFKRGQEMTEEGLSEELHFLSSEHEQWLRKLLRERHSKLQPFDLQEFQNRTGHNLNNMLLHCSYSKKKCDVSDFSV